jgi:hypothetical protein
MFLSYCEIGANCTLIAFPLIIYTSKMGLHCLVNVCEQNHQIGEGFYAYFQIHLKSKP